MSTFGKSLHPLGCHPGRAATADGSGRLPAEGPRMPICPQAGPKYPGVRKERKLGYMDPGSRAVRRPAGMTPGGSVGKIQSNEQETQG